MAYIGQTLTEGTRRVYTYTATASQTDFNAVYGVGAVDVYQNGVLLAPADYTATTGTTVVLGTGAALDDEITIVCHNTFSVADTLTASQGGAFNAALEVNADFTVDTDTLYVDSTNNRVGVGTASPSAPLDVNSSVNGIQAHFGTSSNRELIISSESSGGFDDALTKFSKNSSVGAFAFSNSGGERMRIDSSGNVGIGTNSPQGKLDVTTSGDPDVLIRNSSTGSCSLTLRRNANDDAWTDWTFKNENGKLSLISDDTVQADADRFSINYNGDVVFNDGGLDADFRVESDTNTHAIFLSTYNSNPITSFGTSDGNLHNSNTAGVNIGGNGNLGQLIASCASNRPLILHRSGNNGQIIELGCQTSTVGSVDVTTTGTTYNTTSDRRLKTDIQPIADATDKLMAMNPVSHKWIADPEADAVVGFIAQEMQEIVPEAVSGDPDGEEMMSMDYGRITPVLVSALQDAHKKIERLEQRLKVVEGK